MSSKGRQYGLLLLRVGLGIMFVLHGVPKILGGPPAWERLGSTMALVGLDFMPVVWGLLAGVAEVVGGGLLIIGLFTPFASFAIGCTMVMALAFSLNSSAPFEEFSHPLELLIIALSLMLIGPGKFSLDFLLFPPTIPHQPSRVSRDERREFVIS